MDIHNNGPQGLRWKTEWVKRAQFTLLFIVFIAGSPLYATEDGANGQAPLEREGVVKLVATLEDSPAFTDVVWKLYRLDVPGRPIMVIKRHAAIVSLRPGRYRAVASLQSRIRSRAFNLKSRETAEVILSMDK